MRTCSTFRLSTELRAREPIFAVVSRPRLGNELQMILTILTREYARVSFGGPTEYGAVICKQKTAGSVRPDVVGWPREVVVVVTENRIALEHEI